MNLSGLNCNMLTPILFQLKQLHCKKYEPFKKSLKIHHT